ncbi:hypothetical protein TNCV_3623321 [Trichonephila clavipes]|nr:hypothetical protein TNCV_3623321 [Trichonephila clavipes]
MVLNRFPLDFPSSMETKKVCQSQIRRVRWMRHNNQVIGQKLLDHQSCVGWSIIVNVLHDTFQSSEISSMGFRRSLSVARLILAVFSSFLSVKGCPGCVMSSVDMMLDLKPENHS